MTLPPLTALRAFDCAARHGSFTRAGAELGVTAAAVSLQVRALEDHFGRQLFLRQGNRLTLTDAGRAIQPRVDLAFAELAHLAQDLGQEVGAARLVLSCLPSLADHWLLPRLAGFARLAELDLRVEDDPVDLAGGAVRLTYGAHFYPDHRIETLFTDEIIAVAAPGVGRARLVHTDWGPSHAAAPSWRRWYHEAGIAEVPAPGLRVGQTAMALAAARAGLGAALVPARLAMADLRAGLIERLPGPSLPMPWPYVMVWKPSTRRARLTAELLVHLREG
ncbi:LysR family transcriptional regulator [Tabrizicola sp.]|uniref:LysR family transcriptional regulator n=1 Tax=Tabrizicola sp. TaxID=2005166 RepID=UPI003D27340C